jgi:osmotically-inducible protein OsmY
MAGRSRLSVFIYPLVLSLLGCSQLTAVPLGSHVNDMNVRAAVSERIAAERTSEFTRVKIKVDDGVVYLAGAVSSEEAKTRAENVVFRVPGIKGIVNNIEVEKR